MQVFNQRRIFPVVIQVTSLIISNFITWIVPTVIYLVCLILEYYPKDTLAWITVIIVPLKCIVDPIIFITVTPKKKRSKHNFCSWTVVGLLFARKDRINWYQLCYKVRYRNILPTIFQDMFKRSIVQEHLESIHLGLVCKLVF